MGSARAYVSNADAVVPERVLEQTRDAVQEVDLLERVGRAADLHLVHANELRPVARRLVHRLEHRRGAEGIAVAVLEALERPQGRLVVHLPLKDVAVELHRARHVVEVLLVELRDPVLEARRLVRVAGHLALASEHRQELGPVLGALVEHVEPRERLQVVRIELEDLRVRVDRARDVAELPLVDGADLVVDPLLLVDVGDQIGLPRVDGEQVLPARRGRGSGARARRWRGDRPRRSRAPCCRRRSPTRAG